MVNKNQNFKRGGAMGCDLHGFGLPMHPNESRPGIEIQMSKWVPSRYRVKRWSKEGVRSPSKWRAISGIDPRARYRVWDLGFQCIQGWLIWLPMRGSAWRRHSRYSHSVFSLADMVYKNHKNHKNQNLEAWVPFYSLILLSLYSFTLSLNLFWIPV